METAERDAKQLRKQDSRSEAVHKVEARSFNSTGKCYRCNGKNHSPEVCHFKDLKCHSCGKTGHIKRACKGKVMAAHTNRRRHEHSERNTKYVEAETELPMFTLGIEDCKQTFKTNFKVDDKDIEMEIDTGAAVSIISEQLFQRKFPEQPLDAASVKLRTYTGDVMPVLGQFEAKVSYSKVSSKDNSYL